jgi:hypothetical protein
MVTSAVAAGVALGAAAPAGADGRVATVDVHLYVGRTLLDPQVVVNVVFTPPDVDHQWKPPDGADPPTRRVDINFVASDSGDTR